MSHYIEKIDEIIRKAQSLSSILKNADWYLAHIAKEESRAPELFEEHYDRVNNYFRLICNENELDKVIDNLIEEYVKLFFAKSDFHEVCLYIKRLFAYTIVFHDFGKVNENFQAHPGKMNNPKFKTSKNSPLKHHHSKLGAYIYVTKHFQEITIGLPFLDNSEKRQMLFTVLLFSYSIIKHHAVGLLKPDGEGICFENEEIETMKKYLACYGFQINQDISERALTRPHLKKHFFQWVYENNKIEFGFDFFALLRLNFSLLTAADYLATGQYSYNLSLNGAADWGILNEEQRSRIIQAAEEEKPYNVEAYRLFRQGDYKFQNPQSQSEANLNVLRTEMAVKVLQQIDAHKDKRLFYLEAPTGGGKTNLSMLAVAELLRTNPELKKIFYVFPFTTLITQTHKSIKDTLNLKDDEIALLHSKIGFQTKNGDIGEETQDGIYGSKRRDFLQNLFALYPVMLVTHIRFFDILKSNGKEENYLMHRLANSIVVLDELQSYHPRHWDKMMYMLDQYGKYFNIRFILMSATLPRLDKIKAVKEAVPDMPIAEDLLPNSRDYFTNPNFKGRVKFNFELLENKEEITEPELAKIVLEKSKQKAALDKSEGRVFTIVEFIFKKTATAFKEEVENLDAFFDHIFVLSGTILESRRREIIYFLKRNRKAKNLKVLLITTQVVEAGVDIDMDLGFKNVSLIDSDEQLAGRVNRNVGKEDCVVYLFNLNDASVLYGGDDRYKITRRLDAQFHKEILENKDFSKLYDQVFKEGIDKRNESTLFENFSNYHRLFKKLDFPEIHKKFKLIAQDTLSIFIPACLPIEIEGETREPELFFTDFEQAFLIKNKIFNRRDSAVDGEAVWSLYHHMMENPEDDFIAKKIERKAIQGILAKFTFSIFNNGKIYNSLVEYANPELSFENYLYLSHYDRIYDMEAGLLEAKLNDSENCIL